MCHTYNYVMCHTYNYETHREVCQWSANRLVIAAASAQSSVKYHARNSLPVSEYPLFGMTWNSS